jgi:hypothetical protein
VPHGRRPPASRAGKGCPGAPHGFTFPVAPGGSTLGCVPGHRTDLTLSRLTYDLRARYRVFEFEAAQDGSEDCAALFAALSETEGDQVRVLLHGLRERLVAAEPIASEEPA